MDREIASAPTDGSCNSGYDPRFRLPLTPLMRLAREFYRTSFARTDDDDLAYRICVQCTERGHQFRLDRPPEPDDTERADNANSFWMAKWCACGFPRLRIRALRAASLAATAIPGGVVGSVRPPWPAFLVNLEGVDDLLPDPDRPGFFYDQVEVLYTSVLGGEPTWSFWRKSLSSEARVMLGTRAEDWGSDLDSLRLFDHAAGDPQARLFQVVSRIVLGACLMLSAPGQVEQTRNRARSKRFRRSGPPGMTDFVLGNDVRVDVREPVRDYILRGGSSPTVQSLVRGHWKYQAHGPQYSLRKLIHVEPYWRGPEDGPVVVRAHRLGEPTYESSLPDPRPRPGG